MNDKNVSGSLFHKGGWNVFNQVTFLERDDNTFLNLWSRWMSLSWSLGQRYGHVERTRGAAFGVYRQNTKKKKVWRKFGAKSRRKIDINIYCKWSDHSTNIHSVAGLSGTPTVATVVQRYLYEGCIVLVQLDGHFGGCSFLVLRWTV